MFTWPDFEGYYDISFFASSRINFSEVGRCRLTVSKPVLKAPDVSAFEAIIDEPLSTVAFKFNLCRYSKGMVSSNGGFGFDKIWLWHERSSVVTGVRVGRCELKPVLKAPDLSAWNQSMINRFQI